MLKLLSIRKTFLNILHFKTKQNKKRIKCDINFRCVGSNYKKKTKTIIFHTSKQNSVFNIMSLGEKK